MICSLRRCRRSGFALAGVFAVSAPLAFAPPAGAAAYNFTPLVQNTPSGLQLSGAAAINNDGTVTFIASDHVRAETGVYQLRGGVVSPLYTVQGPVTLLRLAQNDRGDVAFYQQVGNVETVYKVPAGAAAPVVVASDAAGRYGTIRLFPSRLLLGEDGRVVFPALLPDDSYGTFDGPDPLANRVIPADAPIGTAQLQFIRPDGTVLVRGITSTVPLGIYKGTDPQRDLVMNLSRYASPTAYVENASGAAAFFGFVLNGTGGGNSGIYTGPDPVADLLADDTGPFAEFVGGPEIAADGTIVFNASLDGGGRGIFTGPDVLADKILAPGDPLFGSTIVSVASGLGEGSLGALNDRGQLVFSYSLANGQRGLALASPVPEPAGLALAALGAAGCLCRRRR